MGSTTTLHAIPYPAGGDAVQVPVDMQALAERVDASLPVVAATAPATPVFGSIWRDSGSGLIQIFDGTTWSDPYAPASCDYRTRASAVTGVDNRANGFAIAAYDGTASYSKGSDISFTAGTWTINRAGLYEWKANVGFSAEVGAVAVFARFNGTGSPAGNGAAEVPTTGTGHRTQVNAGGPFIAAAGDTVQLAVNYLDGVDNNVLVNYMSLRRLG